MQKILFYYMYLLKSLNFRKVYNFLLVETSYFLSILSHRVIVFGKPWAASLEPTNFCNLRCTQCPTGMQLLARSKGNMSLEDFDRILDKLSTHLIYLTLYFQGEPFLNLNFTEMVTRARSRNIFVSTSTNGHFLDDENINRIIHSGLNHLIISVDGLDQDTYETYRSGGNLSKVQIGILQLVKARNEANSAFPCIELQFIVMKHNEHQMAAMRHFAKQAGVEKLSFKTAQIYNFEVAADIIPASGRKSRYTQVSDGTWRVTRKKKNRCHRIWSSLVVTWDGLTVPCCYDKDAGFRTGNLLQSSLDDIWRNKFYNEFRKRVLTKRQDIPICCNCDER